MRTWALLASAIAASSCLSGQDGERGLLQFSYTGSNMFDLAKPIAVGGVASLYVCDASEGKMARVSEVESTPPGILHPSAIEQDRIDLQALAEGSTLLTVKAISVRGERLTDEVRLTTRRPEVVTLAHLCGTQAQAHYLVESSVALTCAVGLRNGGELAGDSACPVAAAPAAGTTLTPGRAHLWVRTPSAPGELTLSSTVDQASLTLQLHASAEIDGLDFAPGPRPSTSVGESQRYRLVARVGGAGLCQAWYALEASTSTPGICSVKASSVATVPDLWLFPPEEPAVEVTGIQAGTCRVELRVPAAKAGAGILAGGDALIIP